MKHILTLIVFTCISIAGNAQKLTSGSFSPLSSEQEVDLQFTYDDMRVGKMSETDYLAEKMAAYDEKEPGRGEKFQNSWYGDRVARFEPKFEELFNDNGPIKGSRDNDNSRYTFVIHTTFTEPGFNIGVMKRAASINATVTLVETASGEKVGAMLFEGMPGSQFAGYDYDTGSRLAESYAKLGKELRKYLAKKVFK